jgi:hypothetical protein
MHLHTLQYTQLFATLLTAFNGQTMAPRSMPMWAMEMNAFRDKLVIIV